jgi:hypothetical protein
VRPCSEEVDYTVDDATQVVTMTGGRAVPPLDFDDTPGRPNRGSGGQREEEADGV